MARTRIAWTLKSDRGRDMVEGAWLSYFFLVAQASVNGSCGGLVDRCLLVWVAEKRPITEVVGLAWRLVRTFVTIVDEPLPHPLAFAHTGQVCTRYRASRLRL